MMTIPLTLVSVSHEQWYELLDRLSNDLVLNKAMSHPSLRLHVKVVRVANFTLRDLAHARTLHFTSRRIWLGIQIPGSGRRKLHAETHEALKAWKDILIGTPFFHNMLPSPWCDATASADACATATEAGLGGILRLHGKVVAWFGFTISYQDAQECFPWISDSMQKHINAWELLAQFALAFCLHHSLPGRCSPISVSFACDNTSAEAAHLKALSTSMGLCPILAAFFRFQRLHNLDVSIRHILGAWNDEADALSRGRFLDCCPPEIPGLLSTRTTDIPWQWLCSSKPSCSPAIAKFPRTLVA